MSNERSHEGSARETSVYTVAPPVPAFEDCAFYHTMEVPGHGLVHGQWDLRGGESAYLGGVNFAGKRVLEVGTADGFLSFYIESQGGEVVAYDLSANDSWDLVPFSRPALGTPTPEEWRASIRKLNNAFWYARNALGSSAQACHGSVYEVPEGIGKVDTAVLGSILLHVRDPFLALQRVLRLTKETVVVADLPSHPRAIPIGIHRASYAARRLLRHRSRVSMQLLPDYRTGKHWDAWWGLPPELVMNFLGILGFEESRVTFSRQLYNGRSNTVYTVVGQRTDDRLLLGSEDG